MNNPKTYLRHIYLTALRYFIAGLLLTIALCSCQKSNEILVTVDQGGESIRVTGYLSTPVDYNYAYSIDIDLGECGKTKYLVVIKRGQTSGFRLYQSNCKFSAWKITYAGELKQ